VLYELTCDRQCWSEVPQHRLATERTIGNTKTVKFKKFEITNSVPSNIQIKLTAEKTS
jgi:hypothetical protein